MFAVKHYLIQNFLTKVFSTILYSYFFKLFIKWLKIFMYICLHVYVCMCVWERLLNIDGKWWSLFFLVYWGLKKCSTGRHSSCTSCLRSTWQHCNHSCEEQQQWQLSPLGHSKYHLLRGGYPDTALQKPILGWILAYSYTRTFCGHSTMPATTELQCFY